MPTPSERLQKIVDSRIPSKVVFTVKSIKGESLFLEAKKTKPQETKIVTEDIELQDALIGLLEERWNGDIGQYYIPAGVDSLWDSIKRTILSEYLSFSKRCDATKRKTQLFIDDIKIEDKHLPNYLVQVFLKISAKGYKTSAISEREELFEQFESLRKTYGKRNR